jgi:hypothetical protein
MKIKTAPAVVKIKSGGPSASAQATYRSRPRPSRCCASCNGVLRQVLEILSRQWSKVVFHGPGLTRERRGNGDATD